MCGPRLLEALLPLTWLPSLRRRRKEDGEGCPIPALEKSRGDIPLRRSLRDVRWWWMGIAGCLFLEEEPQGAGRRLTALPPREGPQTVRHCVMPTHATTRRAGREGCGEGHVDTPTEEEWAGWACGSHSPSGWILLLPRYLP